MPDCGIPMPHTPNASAFEDARQTPRIEITERQLECLYWVARGKSANDIGGILGISRRTVEGHLLKACEHLGVKTRHQAAWKARELGLLGPIEDDAP